MVTPADIALSLEPIEPRTRARLIGFFGSAQAVYAASRSELVGQARLTPKHALGIASKRFHAQAEQELRRAEREGIHILTPTHPDYPPLLAQVDDLPQVLYLRGESDLLRAPMVAMVGTRKVTTYGLAVCNRLIEQIAQRMPEAVIVSGLAFGVDVACHRAALHHGLRTIGVMATPIHQVYPSVHRAVADQMMACGGALVSEMSSLHAASKYAFLQRNRIVAGMSAGTIVVQSPDRGGSMVTASIADSYDRPLMCPPGPINEAQSEGTNRLLRTLKARMVCSGGEVLEELGWLEPAAVHHSAQADAPSLRGDQKTLYEAICASPQIALEELQIQTGMPAQELLGVILELEFAGHIRSLPGNQYERFH